MKTARMAAIPALILAGGLVLAGCGDPEAPAASPSPSASDAMMEDDKMEEDKMEEDKMEEDDMMSPSPSDDAMMEEDDTMEEDS
jgi:hypothetical protein